MSSGVGIVSAHSASNLAHRSRQPTRSIRSDPSSLADKGPQPSRTTNKQPSLARRLLFPHLPPDASLPPFLASHSAEPELNGELYDFTAIALRAYVNPWWTKLTRYDKEFLPQITRILTALLRVIEARLTSTDLSPLIFRDLPALVNQHYIDYRNAQSKLLTSYASGGTASLPQLFHQTQSHMAVSPEGIVNKEYIRQAVDSVLRTCLPEEDYAPEAERYIIREIVVKVLAAGVIPKLTQPWFLHKLILDLLGPDKSADKQVEVSDPDPADPNGATATDGSARPLLRRQSSGHVSFQSMAIFVLSAVRSISGICLALIHAYKQALDTIKKVNDSKPLFPPRSVPQPQPDLTIGSESEENSPLLKPVLPGTLVPPTPLTPGIITPSPSHSNASSRTSSTFSMSRASQPPRPPPPPNYTQSPLLLLSTLLHPPPPPLSSPHVHFSNTLSLALRHILSLIVTLLSPFLSRLLPYLLYTHLFSPSVLSMTVKNARRALFPEGWPAPPPVDPTPEEQAYLRKELERRLEMLVPGPLTHLLGPNPAAVSCTISSMLEPFSSQPCNVHIFVLILDLALVTVFPEMGVIVEGAPSPVVGGEGGGSLSRRRERELTPPRPDSRPP